MLTIDVCSHAKSAVSRLKHECDGPARRASESKSETDSESIEEQVADLLGLLFKQLEVLEHLLVDLDLVDVTDRVLSQEVEDNARRGRKRDVLEAERAAADRVGLVGALLVAVTEREAVDEVDGRRALPHHRLLVLEVRRVVLAHSVDVLLERARLLELLVVALALEGRTRGEKDVSARVESHRR